MLLARAILAWVEQPGHGAFTSTITLTELLAKPYATLDPLPIQRVKQFLLAFPNLRWVATDIEIADFAGRLRAEHRLKTSDAIHAATAIQMGASGFVTNDAIFKRIPDFETLVIDQLL